MPRRKQDDDNGRDELSKALAVARQAAGLKQTDVAKATDLTQNKLSRVENGQAYLLTETEMSALLALYKIRGEQRKRVMNLLKESRDETVPARVIIQGGAHRFQQRLEAIAKQAATVRSFVPTSAIGYLQTRDYMSVVFNQRSTPEQAALAIESRLKQQRLLADPNRQWHMIQTEGGLRWNFGGAAVMVDQVDKLITATYHSNVRLGMIPWHKEVTMLPLTGFHIYDNRVVVVGTWSGTALIRDREKIGQYERLFDRLASFAVYGDAARAELRRIADEYRSLSVSPKP